MITTVFCIAILAAIAKIITLAKLGVLNRALGFDWLLDGAAGVTFAWLFWGTLTGMVIATLAGLIFSIALWLWKKAFGYERLVWKGWRFQWQRIPPAWVPARTH